MPVKWKSRADDMTEAAEIMLDGRRQGDSHEIRIVRYSRQQSSGP